MAGSEDVNCVAPFRLPKLNAGSAGLKNWSVLKVHEPFGLPGLVWYVGSTCAPTPIFQECAPELIVSASRNWMYLLRNRVPGLEPQFRLGKR